MINNLSLKQEKIILLEGTKVVRRSIIESSGKFLYCLLYEEKLYEIHLSHGWIYNVFQLEKKDKNEEYKDREDPRVNKGFFKHNFPQDYDEYLL